MSNLRKAPRNAAKTAYHPLPRTMPLLNTLEQKFGRLAISNIVRVIAALQFINWFLLRISPGFGTKLIFDPSLILQGEIWRLVSYVVLPGGTSIIWLLTISFMWMINDGLEQAWGSFRLNLYVFFGMFCMVVGGFIWPMQSTGWVLWATLLFAFAVYFPDQEILLFFILPIKIKWLALMSAAGLGFVFISVPGAMRMNILFSLLNFLITFGPGFIQQLKHRGEVADRRRRFESAKSDVAYFHKCHVCGKTEIDDATLDFRITASGDEICNACRAAKTLE